MESLPAENQAVLKALLVHLEKVCAHSAVNKMQMPNIATVFGPTLLRARPAENSSGFDMTVLTMVNDTPVINSLAMHVINGYEYIFCGKEILETYIYTRALYAFQGEDPATELTFEPGDIIKVTVMNPDPSQWWMGEINNKSGCFPGGYVVLLPDDEQKSLSRIAELTSKLEFAKKQTQDLNVKVDTSTATLIKLQKDYENLTNSVDKQKKVQSEITLQFPKQFAEFQQNERELSRKSAQDDSAMWVSLEKYQVKLVEELDLLTISKYKPKLDKEGFQTKFDTLKMFIEQGKSKREFLKKDSNVLVNDLVIIEKWFDIAV